MIRDLLLQYYIDNHIIEVVALVDAQSTGFLTELCCNTVMILVSVVLDPYISL